MDKIRLFSMKTEIFNNPELVAPCGINCGTCRAFLRSRNKCPGCRIDNQSKPITRVTCKIKSCEKRLKENLDFCFECGIYPCTDIQKLDKRYRTTYDLNLLDNQNEIKKIGLSAFLKNESIRWRCLNCGGTVCVHTSQCSLCGKEKEK